METDRPGWVRRAATKLSPVLFGFALLAFLVPFASVSCATPRGYGSAGGGVTATYRGITLVTGGMPELSVPENGPQICGPTAEDNVTPQPFAVGAFALTVVGLAAALWPLWTPRRRALKSAIAAAGAAFSTAVAFVLFDQRRTAQIVERLTSAGSGGLAQADVGAFVAPGLGFWAILLLLSLAALLNGALVLPYGKRLKNTSESAEPSANRSAPAAANA
jgi:hypothetical protein